MTDPYRDIEWPSRRQKRLIDFLAPQREANERIALILSFANEKVWTDPMTPLGPRIAIVLTNQRVFEIRLQVLTARPKKTLAAHTRESVTADWTRDAKTFADSYSATTAGQLTITSPAGSKALWVTGGDRKDRAQAIAAALNTDRASG
jgi:hypothetical protein